MQEVVQSFTQRLEKAYGAGTSTCQEDQAKNYGRCTIRPSASYPEVLVSQLAITVDSKKIGTCMYDDLCCLVLFGFGLEDGHAPPLWLILQHEPPFVVATGKRC